MYTIIYVFVLFFHLQPVTPELIDIRPKSTLKTALSNRIIFLEVSGRK